MISTTASSSRTIARTVATRPMARFLTTASTMAICSRPHDPARPSGEALNIHHNLFLDGRDEKTTSAASARRTAELGFNSTTTRSSAVQTGDTDAAGRARALSRRTRRSITICVVDNDASVTAFWVTNSGTFAGQLRGLTGCSTTTSTTTRAVRELQGLATNRNFTRVQGAVERRCAATCRKRTRLSPTVTFAGAGDYRLSSNGQDALTASDVGGPVGCYVTGSEEIGVRTSPGY